MRSPRFGSFHGQAAPRRFRGVTLVEVLVAIILAGVALLALLVLFPLGVLNLAQAIEDDRAPALALDAAELSRDGLELLSQTREFLGDALLSGGADPATAAALRIGYEKLESRAADLGRRLKELAPLAQQPRLRVQLLASIARIKAIETTSAKMVTLLGLLEQPNQDGF
jgi:prepilin-type N-terminal cleavage/methylation domain-containing protein